MQSERIVQGAVAGAIIGFLMILMKTSIGTANFGAVGPLIGALGGGVAGGVMVATFKWRKEGGKHRRRFFYWLVGSICAGPLMILVEPIAPADAADPVFWLGLFAASLLVGAFVGLGIYLYAEILGLE